MAVLELIDLPHKLRVSNEAGKMLIDLGQLLRTYLITLIKPHFYESPDSSGGGLRISALISCQCT